MQRAIVVGRIISVSQHRLVDLLTIFVGTLEMQLHVLTRLGKQPSLAAWRLLLARCGASLFVNTYLSRQDAVWVTLAIKKAAMGFQAAGDVAGEAADALDAGDLDLDEGLFSGPPRRGRAGRRLRAECRLGRGAPARPPDRRGGRGAPAGGARRGDHVLPRHGARRLTSGRRPRSLTGRARS